MNKEQLEIVRKDIEFATECGLTISYQKYGLTLSNAVESFKLWIERGCKL